MANEYGEIENLVNDVTSLDTARMTLRWALERLNNIEKEKADLKKNLTLAEETAKRLQVKDASLTDAYSSRNKTLEEKEDFYTKLEATMSLLGEGKLDIQQLLKKEAKLDSLRHNLESEYSDKFEELDRNQRSVIERWNSRLLEVETQYAGRLAEAQKKYDGLRTELEGDYQGRINSLQASFTSREKFLSERIGGLEKSVHQSEEKVETRRRELEGEYLVKKREAEENYRKLKNMLEAGLEEKIRSVDGDHAEQVRAFEASWQIERARLLEEQHVREAQYASAQDRIKEIENALALQQETHHSELLKIISEKETAFRAQLAVLEAEKGAKEATVRELQARLEKRGAAWDADRTSLQAEFDGRIGVIEAGLKQRAASLEKAYKEKREALETVIAASRAGFEKKFEARLQAERQSMDIEKSILEGEKRAREEALAVNAARLNELEYALTATREEHHKDLLARLSVGEASFREKLACFESEKQAYNETINDLTDELRRRENSLIEEKNKIAAEFEAKSAIHGEMLARTEVAFGEKRRAYEEKIASLSIGLEGAAKASVLEKENFQKELARVSANAQSLAEERTALIRADYENRKAGLEMEFAARYNDRLKALEAEKARVNETLAESEKQREFSNVKTMELDAAIAGLRRSASEEKAALSRDYSAGLAAAQKTAEEDAKAREAELLTDINVLREELTGKDRALSVEREKLAAELFKVSADAHNRIEESASVLRVEYEQRLAAHAAMSANSLAAVKDLLAGKEAMLEKAGEARLEAEHNLKAAFEAEKVRWIGEKERLAADFELKMTEFDATLGERVANIRSDYEARKADLGKEFSVRYGDRLKAMEGEKARMTEALAEREGQLAASYARASERDNAIAELRRASADEKIALAREHSAVMGQALKNAEEGAKVRETELVTEINALRCELAEKERVLVLQRGQHSGELSKAVVEAHERSEESAASIRNDYERRLQKSEAAAGIRVQELRVLLGEKEAHLEKVLENGRESEKAIRAAAEKNAEERLQAAVEARTAGIHNALEAGAREAAYLKEFIADLKARLADTAVTMNNLEDDMVAKKREYQAELIKVQQENAVEFEVKMKNAIAAAVYSVSHELADARDELKKLQARHVEEAAACKLVSEEGKKELFMLAEEAENRLRQAEEKILKLENELAAGKAEASRELVARTAEHDAALRRFLLESREKYAVVGRENAARLDGERRSYEARIAELEKVLDDKARSLEEERALIAKKLSDLWRLEAEVTGKTSVLRDEKIKAERETDEKRHGLEREYNKKFSELERLKTELGKTIMEYKNVRKAE